MQILVHILILNQHILARSELIQGMQMNMIESTSNYKNNEKESRFASLPFDLQLQIKRYLQQGDFRSAKALFDQNLESREKH